MDSLSVTYLTEFISIWKVSFKKVFWVYMRKFSGDDRVGFSIIFELLFLCMVPWIYYICQVMSLKL